MQHFTVIGTADRSDRININTDPDPDPNLSRKLICTMVNMGTLGFYYIRAYIGCNELDFFLLTFLFYFQKVLYMYVPMQEDVRSGLAANIWIKGSPAPSGSCYAYIWPAWPLLTQFNAVNWTWQGRRSMYKALLTEKVYKYLRI